MLARSARAPRRVRRCRHRQRRHGRQQTRILSGRSIRRPTGRPTSTTLRPARLLGTCPLSRVGEITSSRRRLHETAALRRHRRGSERVNASRERTAAVSRDVDAVAATASTRRPAAATLRRDRTRVPRSRDASVSRRPSRRNSPRRSDRSCKVSAARRRPLTERSQNFFEIGPKFSKLWRLLF